MQQHECAHQLFVARRRRWRAAWPAPASQNKSVDQDVRWQHVSAESQNNDGSARSLKIGARAPASRTIASEMPSHVSLARAATASATLQLHQRKRSSIRDADEQAKSMHMRENAGESGRALAPAAAAVDEAVHLQASFEQNTAA